MTTKEQERKALEQIKKIVEGLGEDSYIGFAFEGCFEDAEYNIQNDCAMSWCNRAQTAEKACDLRRDEAYKLREENEKLKKELALAKQTVQQEADRADNGWKRVKELNEQVKEAVDEMCREQVKTVAVELKLKDKEEEIIRLKAKLYDLMTKEG